MTESKNAAAVREILQRAILTGESNIIAKMFDAYRLAVMPPDAGPVQVLECKRAYFAGARGLLDLLDAATDPGMDATEVDLKIYQEINAELAAWMSDGQMAEHMAAVPPAGEV